MFRRPSHLRLQKAKQNPAKCTNCSGPHPANFSGCPQNPKNSTNNKKKQPTKKSGRRNQERALRTPHHLNNCTQLQLKNTKHDFDVSQVMTQMSQMMTQWGQMLSIIQAKI
ncbi:hypothetical protein TNCV_2546581 [Trichonephila clavipes]|nr:hypothetical protein TNCV_2546581 [Trichonephila clavipes]